MPRPHPHRGSQSRGSSFSAPSSPLERETGFVVFRPLGHVTFPQVVQTVAAAIAQARDEGAKSLLVVGTGLSGFEPPSVAERHQMIRQWATAAEGRITLAVVMHREFIDPDKFGAMAARNFGLVGNVFETEDEAVAWLKQSH